MFRRSQPALQTPLSKGKSTVSTSGNQALFNRPDTLLGVCEGIGREFGFHPNILRIAFAVPMIWNPVAVISAYFGLGAALWLSHKIAPNRRPAAVEQPVAAEQTDDQREMALAA
jgi:phage shock protein PspC (stress-responsive transcriptional regulator)